MPFLSQELDFRLSAELIVPAIVEVRSQQLGELQATLVNAGIPVRSTSRFEAIDRAFIGTLLNRDAVDSLAADPAFIAFHYDRAIRIVQFPLMNRLVSRVSGGISSIPAMTRAGGPYKRPDGVITTAEVRKLLGAEHADADNIDGSGVKVAVVDTGFEATRQLKYRDVTTFSAKAEQGGEVDTSGHSCVHGDARVYTSFCGVEKFSVLYDRLEAKYGGTTSEHGTTVHPDEALYTVGFKDGHAARTRIRAVHKIPFNGDVIEVRAAQGRFVTSPWHLFSVRHPMGAIRYVRADRLQSGHLLVIPDHPVGVTDGGIDVHMAYIAGFTVGDGHLTHKPRSNTALLSPSKTEMPRLRAFVEACGYKTCLRKDGFTLDVSRLWKPMVALGIPTGRKSNIVRVPDVVFKSGTDAQRAFIAGLFEADGWFHKTENRATLSTTSFGLAEDVQHLLATLGVVSRIFRQNENATHEIAGKPIKQRAVVYHLKVGRNHARKFRALVAPYCILKDVHVPTDSGWHVVRVKSVVRSRFIGHLYDFSTDTENYLAGENAMVAIHNTWCANTIAGPRVELTEDTAVHGIAPGVSLATVRVLYTPLGAGTNSDVLEGVRIALETFGADVISMSLGSESPTPPGDPSADIIREYTARGVIFCIAAGNSGQKGAKTINSPGDVEEALTVGSISATDSSETTLKRSYYSSVGPTSDGRNKPDVVAFGGGRASKDAKPHESILSSSTGLIDSLDKVPNKLAAIMGTSMATPEIAAVCALGRQLVARDRNEMLTTDAIKALLKKRGNRSVETGWGLLTYNDLRGLVT